MKRRAGEDYSLDMKRYDDSRGNQTNPLSSDPHQYFNKEYRDRLSPHSRMIFQSEAQFLDNYGARRSERPMRLKNGQIEENSIWDKLSRIFTFGCIETSHNNKQ